MLGGLSSQHVLTVDDFDLDVYLIGAYLLLYHVGGTVTHVTMMLTQC